jgi:hypothetical protein
MDLASQIQLVSLEFPLLQINGPTIRRRNSRQATKERGLSRSIRSKQTQDLPGSISKETWSNARIER